MRYIKPKYCPRTKSPDMPLKKAHIKCTFRHLSHDQKHLTCNCPSGIRYLSSHRIKGVSLLKQMVLCRIGDSPGMKTATIQERYVTAIERYVTCPHCEKDTRLHSNITATSKYQCQWCKNYFRLKKCPDDVWDDIQAYLPERRNGNERS